MAKTPRIITATAILILSLPISPARKINKTHITTSMKRWGGFFLLQSIEKYLFEAKRTVRDC